MTNWNKVVANMGRGMDPMSAYNRAEREEREERQAYGASARRQAGTQGRALDADPFWDA